MGANYWVVCHHWPDKAKHNKPYLKPNKTRHSTRPPGRDTGSLLAKVLTADKDMGPMSVLDPHLKEEVVTKVACFGRVE